MPESFAPIQSPHSRVLILGTMPGVMSLAAGQYYAHARNHFWPIMGALLGFAPDDDYEKRCRILEQSGAALWDVLRYCRREGSLDSNIEAEQPNDIAGFLTSHKGIRAVFFNGANAQRYFKKYTAANLQNGLDIHLERLPSTSPANASMDFNAKLNNWRRILDFLYACA